jgi:hypothetical protein
MKALMPDAGCRRIADSFNRRFARNAEPKRRATVGKSFVAETIRAHRYEIDVARRQIKHRVPRPARAHGLAEQMLMDLARTPVPRHRKVRSATGRPDR